MLHSVGCVPAARMRPQCRLPARFPPPATAPVRCSRVSRRNVVKVQNVQLSTPLTGTGISELAKQMIKEPFVGCNCYYLLPYAAEDNLSSEHTREKVKETLNLIRTAGFKVVRIWAFSNGPDPWNIHKSPGGAINFEPLTWLLNTVQTDYPELKLMMTLTNGALGYGGYWQYVKWANGDLSATNDNDFENPERYNFWLRDGVGPTARAFCASYISQVVAKYKDYSCIHSWDICNEPRNRLDGTRSIEIGDWVRNTAALIKSLDQTHPVTVGSEGFFGPSPPALVDWRSKNPFHDSQGQSNRWNEGCNWLYESSDIDFVTIHTWADQWNKTEQPDQWLKTNKDWIDIHIEACQTLLGNKPLVIQEYNMPTRGGLRDGLYQYVRDKYLEDNPLIGVMVWMIGHEGYPPRATQDGYTLCPSFPELQPGSRLIEMCTCRSAVRGR